MTTRTLAPLLALCAAAALGACADPLRIRARLDVVTDTLSAYSIDDPNAQLPAALTTAAPIVDADGNFARVPAVVRVSPAFDYDVAFRLQSNSVVVIPARLTANSLAGAHRVGLQLSDSAFDDIKRAPAKGYQYDSVAVTVPVGKVVFIEANPSVCSSELSTTIYSKLIIDSIPANAQRVFFRIAVDPNCGFRSFLPGIPTS
jgi:hypothetical protein